MNCADNDVDNKVWDADCTGYKICQNVRSHLFLGQNVPLLKFSSIVISVYELNIWIGKNMFGKYMLVKCGYKVYQLERIFMLLFF